MSPEERGAEAIEPWEVLGHSMCLPPDGMDLLRDALEETRLSVVLAVAPDSERPEGETVIDGKRYAVKLDGVSAGGALRGWVYPIEDQPTEEPT